MKQLVTPAIILSRTDYGEADRILTMLTPEYGKVTLIAKGVRRIKSKLAGGIELFSVSEITFIKGRGGVGTLVSTRLTKHYSRVVGELDRTMLGYDIIKRLHKATEDEPEPAYFQLLQQAFEALDNTQIPLEIIKVWFFTQLLQLGGHTPNLRLDSQGRPLASDQRYEFSFDSMAFTTSPDYGHFNASHIKLLRLCFGGNTPHVLSRIESSEELASQLLPLVQSLQTRN